MQNKIYSLSVSACLFMVTPLISNGAISESFNGSNNIVCAVKDVISCVENTACVQGPVSVFELPEFIIMDAKKKVIRASYESGHTATSPIKTLENNGDHLILQGVEEGRGWNVSIDAKNGNMNGSGVGDGLGFLVRGNCTTL